jgi:hypothetical protein
MLLWHWQQCLHRSSHSRTKCLFRLEQCKRPPAPLRRIGLYAKLLFELAFAAWGQSKASSTRRRKQATVECDEKGAIFCHHLDSQNVFKSLSSQKNHPRVGLPQGFDSSHLAFAFLHGRQACVHIPVHQGGAAKESKDQTKTCLKNSSSAAQPANGRTKSENQKTIVTMPPLSFLMRLACILPLLITLHRLRLLLQNIIERISTREIRQTSSKILRTSYHETEVLFLVSLLGTYRASSGCCNARFNSP